MFRSIDTCAEASIGRLLPPVLRTAVRMVASLPLLMVDKAVDWQQRSVERRHLMALPDHLLKDIGMSRADAAREAGKPFWRL